MRLQFLNKKGVSGVIAMILMVGLTIVAIAIVWGVINNLISNKTKGAECIEVFDKVLINDYYTCYDPTTHEMKISLEIKDVEIDGVLVAVYGSSQSKNFEVPSSGYSYVKPYGGSYSGNLTIPSKNSAKTYVFNVNSTGIGAPSMIKISPTVDDHQCEVSDSLLNVDTC